MKIVILGPAHPLRPGGITTFNERLCQAFMQAGHTCSIWSFRVQYPSFLFPGSSQFTDSPPPAGLDIRSVIHSMWPLNWWRTGRRLYREKPDLIVVRYWIPFMAPALGTILRLAAKNKHAAIVCIADNIVPHEARPGDRLLTRYFLKPVHHFVVMSRQVMQDLMSFGQYEATLLAHPLYDNFGEPLSRLDARAVLRQRFHLPITDDEPLLLFFGLIRKYKGLDLLLQALPMVQNQQVKLLIAGEWYDKKESYDALLQSAAPRIFLHDRFIANDDVRYFFCAADCVIQPYRHATQSGVTPVAYHFQVPMIVTRVGGLPEMVQHGEAGLLCEPEPQNIAEAIDVYFQKGSAAFEPGLKRMKLELSWNRMVSRLLEIAGQIRRH